MQSGNIAGLPPTAAPTAQVETEGMETSGFGPHERRGALIRAQRRKLPDERKSVTHKFTVGGHEGYIIVGMYEEGAPGEIFIKIAKEGSTLSGFMDGLALSISIGLQYGVPLKAIVDKLTNTRFEPSGYTQNPDIHYASSVLDYIARWLGGKFLSPEYFKPGPQLEEGATLAPESLAVKSPGASPAEKPPSCRGDATSFSTETLTKPDCSS